MNVLYISYDGMTDPLGQSQVIPYLLKLSAHGYQFTLLSCEKPDRYREGKSVVDELLSGTSIKWQPIFYTKNPPVLSTIFDYLKLKRKARQLHKDKPFQVVHCRSYIPSLIGLWFKTRFHTKFVFDMRGFWADERVDGHLWNLKNPLYKTIYTFFKKKEHAFLQNADFVISLTTKGRHEMLQWNGISPRSEKIVVIPCCVDTALFNPAKINIRQQSTIRTELGINEADFVLSYLGSIGTWYMLDEMLDFFSVLKKQQPSAKFLFITQDENVRIRTTAAKKKIADTDIIIKPVSRNEVPLLLSISNWSIFFIRPSYSKMSSSPTKQGEIMAMGIPVICNAGVGDTDEIVNHYQSGLVTDSSNYESVVSRMQSVIIDPQNIRAGANDYFSLDKGVSKYAEIYQSLLLHDKSHRQQ
jgi:glycosyltransferase involved in cell wall biosynthesis